MNNIPIDNLSIICKFLDVESFKNLTKTNKYQNKALKKEPFIKIYKNNSVYQFINNKNLYNFVEKNEMINQIFKYNNDDKYINIILLYIENYFENNLYEVNKMDIYNFTNHYTKNKLLNFTRYDLYNFLVSRNILIKKFLSKINDKFKVVFILYLTRYFVSNFYEVNWYHQDFYKFENKHWESIHNKALQDYLTNDF